MARFVTSPQPIASYDSTRVVAPHFTRGGGSAAPTTRRSNRYGAKCVTCNGWVNAEEGYLAKTAEGKWAAEHILPCPEGTPLYEGDAGVVTRPRATAPTSQVAFSVPDGRYTIAFENGSHKTLRVRTQDESSDFMPGLPVLQHLTGSDNDSDYTSFGHVDARGEVRIWKKHQDNVSLREAMLVLVGDPKAASQAYALETSCCGVCGRTLSTPESIARGIGPDCADRLGW